MSERRSSGILDTCTYIDLYELEPVTLPKMPEITTITLAELHQGVAMAKDPVARAERSERLGVAIVEFDPLPFDEDAATRYGTLVALTLATKRDPRPRKLDLMIAAIASSRGLPLFTRNSADFRGLESMVEIVPV
ncbi:type II toxin-antitoxin system VapC family toxin [Nocardia brasiliensis]|uniref:type II toxin-antitoxin system VapC family toxin n=1 Tax=Nocardia brasiliensis TaxID=37326 RepID=UPI0024546C11|nr:type II toxin-antitoxin system VapC family toxin [Nocardia brasiliensis]